MLEYVLIGASSFIGCAVYQIAAHFIGARKLPQTPDQEFEEERVISDSEIEFGSDRLKELHNEHDARIAALKEELGIEYEQMQNVRPGVIYEEDHSIVDRKYIPVEPEEYAK